jgi:ribosomal protein S18 acetylase RimI-like enzyme
MITILKYEDKLFNDAVDIFSQLSSHYLKENASSKEAIASNLKENVFSKGASVKILLAYYDGSICGLASYAVLYPATKETAQLFLKEIFIAPQYSRKGVGAKMMSNLSKIALDNNCSRFDWTSSKTNTQAFKFYEKIGATAMEEKICYRLSGDELKRMAEVSNDI